MDTPQTLNSVAGMKDVTILKTSVYLFVSLWLYSPSLGLGRFFSFLIVSTVGRTPWTWDQRVARPLPAHRTAQAQNKRTQLSVSRVGFESTTPVFEQAKAAIVISFILLIICSFVNRVPFSLYTTFLDIYLTLGTTLDARAEL
jgi:hypothetical protein